MRKFKVGDVVLLTGIFDGTCYGRGVPSEILDITSNGYVKLRTKYGDIVFSHEKKLNIKKESSKFKIGDKAIFKDNGYIGFRRDLIDQGFTIKSFDQEVEILGTSASFPYHRISGDTANDVCVKFPDGRICFAAVSDLEPIATEKKSISEHIRELQNYAAIYLAAEKSYAAELRAKELKKSKSELEPIARGGIRNHTETMRIVKNYDAESMAEELKNMIKNREKEFKIGDKFVLNKIVNADMEFGFSKGDVVEIIGFSGVKDFQNPKTPAIKNDRGFVAFVSSNGQECLEPFNPGHLAGKYSEMQWQQFESFMHERKKQNLMGMKVGDKATLLSYSGNNFNTGELVTISLILLEWTERAQAFFTNSNGDIGLASLKNLRPIDSFRGFKLGDRCILKECKSEYFSAGEEVEVVGFTGDRVAMFSEDGNVVTIRNRTNFVGSVRPSRLKLINRAENS